MMPCSTTMPVALNSRLENDYSSSRYYGSYTLRNSESSPRYYPRTPIRSSSLTDDNVLRDKSESRESTFSSRSGRRDSATRSGSSLTSGGCDLPKYSSLAHARKPSYMTFDLCEFRTTYGPGCYVPGSQRTTKYLSPIKSSETRRDSSVLSTLRKDKKYDLTESPSESKFELTFDICEFRAAFDLERRYIPALQRTSPSPIKSSETRRDSSVLSTLRKYKKYGLTESPSESKFELTFDICEFRAAYDPGRRYIPALQRTSPSPIKSSETRRDSSVLSTLRKYKKYGLTDSPSESKFELKFDLSEFRAAYDPGRRYIPALQRTSPSPIKSSETRRDSSVLSTLRKYKKYSLTESPSESWQESASSKGNASSKKETENAGLSGLRNIGNTCFLNSVVQCLSHTRLLKDLLLGRDFSQDFRNVETKGCLIKAFTDVLRELWSDEGKIVNTLNFKAQIQRFAPRFMGYNQQDAQEFLRYLLEGLHNDINRVTTKPKSFPELDDNLSDSVKANESWKQYLQIDNSEIVDMFVGQLKSTLQCTSCGHKSTTFEVFWDLSLPLPSRSATSLRLSQCLEHFTKEEVLDGDEMPTCSKCKQRRKCTKRFAIQKFPKILVLHLKRFSPSERYRKLTATVEFPLTDLDMSAYSSTQQSSVYNLYAVSNHSGTAYSGHYTAYCLYSKNQQWYECNDSRVSPISSRNVVSNEAYLLFYEQASSARSSTC